MEKIEYEGEIYYFLGDKFVDSSFLDVSENMSKKLFENHFKINYKTLTEKQALEFLKQAKQMKAYDTCKDICFWILDNTEDPNMTKKILPILTSTLRALKNPKKAIEIAQEFTDKQKCDSAALWASVAMAYYDLFDYKNALSFVNLAQRKERKPQEDNLIFALEIKIKKALGIYEKEE